MKPAAWIEVVSHKIGRGVGAFGERAGSRLYWLRIRARNGEILFSSEIYSTKSNARRAARRAAKILGLTIKEKKS